jgi:DNA recombination protein RmuC
MSTDTLIWVLLILVAINLLLVIWLLLRRRPMDADEAAHRQQLLGQSQQLGQRVERVESELRREISDSSRTGRQEIQQTLATFQETLTRQDAEATRTQNTQLDAFAQQLLQLRGTLGDTLTQQLQAISLGMTQQAAEATRTQNAQIDAFAQQLVQLRGTLGDTLTKQLQDMSEGNARRLAEIRTTLENQAGAAAADQHRQARRDARHGGRKTAEHAAGAAGRELQAGGRPAGAGAQGSGRNANPGAGRGRFEAFADQREDARHVWRGATGRAVGAGVRTRPVRHQVMTKPGSRFTVDFAIKLPGRGDDGAPLLAADRRQVPERRLRTPAGRAAARRRGGR